MAWLVPKCWFLFEQNKNPVCTSRELCVMFSDWKRLSMFKIHRSTSSDAKQLNFCGRQDAPRHHMVRVHVDYEARHKKKLVIF